MNLQDLLARHPLPLLGDGSKDDKTALCILGGPASCPGAVVLAATAALRMGAGRVRVAVHPDAVSAVGVTLPEAAVYGWNAAASPTGELADALEESEVVIVGPGYQHLDDSMVRAVVQRAPRAVLVLDAGALPSAVGLARERRVLVAPNVKEAQRLTDAEETDEVTLAGRLAGELRQPVAVRGACSVVSDGEETWRFDDAPRGLGTPGSGDVFAGVLSALAGALDDPTAALGWAVHLHAASAARLAARTPVGYRASEIVEQLPVVLTEAMG